MEAGSPPGNSKLFAGRDLPSIEEDDEEGEEEEEDMLSSLYALAGAAIGRWSWEAGGGGLDAVCGAHTSQYSPILNDVGIKYGYRDFNGSFLKENVYRLPGSAAVDAAWDALGVNYRPGLIARDEGLRSGPTPAHVQRADKYGGGFFVNVEGLHHLNCLNLVRKALFYNYDYYKALGRHAFANGNHIVQLHVWYGSKEQLGAFPDFNTRHRCKNYDDVRKWAEARQEPPADALPDDYTAVPADDDVLPETP
ncbi:hypothetical protein B0T26DRAFT_753430 [Lasiosphaeria miniovina]|uniref:Uncharacterized protein n=1 Tax=Lasiosphaeria miniovina TaxID=1954250 RepID=A0AA40ACG4_9PEZI|nr:uncharacterized protein B0T26DRAFT_753430 [Lasiosphaeria miniovina]KAK0713306.1 hypothetical protein B0T26DRAFT_753430 [Lasiosphaeria miniovina]